MTDRSIHSASGIDSSLGTLPPAATHVPVLSRLHDEWQRITVRAGELHQVRRWGLPGLPVHSLDEVLDRCGFRTTGCRSTGNVAADGSCSADDYLLQIVRLARHDVLAARIVLQRILPPLCAVARRHTTNRQQRLDMMDELVANAWPAICSYPADRRRCRVAASLVRDITFETLVRPTRRQCAQEIPTDLDLLDDPADQVTTEPIDELVELLHDARTVPGISDGDITFICQLINHGKPELLAATMKVTARTVRNHRDAVVHRLRTLVALAA